MISTVPLTFLYTEMTICPGFLETVPETRLMSQTNFASDFVPGGFFF